MTGLNDISISIDLYLSKFLCILVLKIFRHIDRYVYTHVVLVSRVYIYTNHTKIVFRLNRYIYIYSLDIINYIINNYIRKLILLT